MLNTVQVCNSLSAGFMSKPVFCRACGNLISTKDKSCLRCGEPTESLADKAAFVLVAAALLYLAVHLGFGIAEEVATIEWPSHNPPE